MTDTSCGVDLGSINLCSNAPKSNCRSTGSCSVIVHFCIIAEQGLYFIWTIARRISCSCFIWCILEYCPLITCILNCALLNSATLLEVPVVGFLRANDIMYGGQALLSHYLWISCYWRNISRRSEKTKPCSVFDQWVLESDFLMIHPRTIILLYMRDPLCLPHDNYFPMVGFMWTVYYGVEPSFWKLFPYIIQVGFLKSECASKLSNL